MRRYHHRKLVRDKIPEFIKLSGGSYTARKLAVGEFKKLLRKKLLEEARELVDAPKSKLLNELADLLQLLVSIAEFEKIPFKNLEIERNQKEKRVGGFKKRIFLIWSDKPSGK